MGAASSTPGPLVEGIDILSQIADSSRRIELDEQLWAEIIAQVRIPEGADIQMTDQIVKDQFSHPLLDKGRHVGNFPVFFQFFSRVMFSDYCLHLMEREATRQVWTKSVPADVEAEETSPLIFQTLGPHPPAMPRPIATLTADAFSDLQNEVVFRGGGITMTEREISLAGHLTESLVHIVEILRMLVRHSLESRDATEVLSLLECAPTETSHSHDNGIIRLSFAGKPLTIYRSELEGDRISIARKLRAKVLEFVEAEAPQDLWQFVHRGACIVNLEPAGPPLSLLQFVDLLAAEEGAAVSGVATEILPLGLPTSAPGGPPRTCREFFFQTIRFLALNSLRTLPLERAAVVVAEILLLLSSSISYSRYATASIHLKDCGDEEISTTSSTAPRAFVTLQGRQASPWVFAPASPIFKSVNFHLLFLEGLLECASILHSDAVAGRCNFDAARDFLVTLLKLGCSDEHSHWRSKSAGMSLLLSLVFHDPRQFAVADDDTKGLHSRIRAPAELLWAASAMPPEDATSVGGPPVPKAIANIASYLLCGIRDSRLFPSPAKQFCARLSFEEIVQAVFSDRLAYHLYGLLLYSLLYKNRHFRNFAFGVNSLVSTSIPLLSAINRQIDGTTFRCKQPPPQSVDEVLELPAPPGPTILMLVLLSMSRDDTLSFFEERLESVPDWLDVGSAHKKSSISIGAIILHTLIKVSTWNYSQSNDPFIHEIVGAIFANVAGRVKELPWNVAERLVKFHFFLSRQLTKSLLHYKEDTVAPKRIQSIYWVFQGTTICLSSALLPSRVLENLQLLYSFVRGANHSENLTDVCVALQEASVEERKSENPRLSRGSPGPTLMQHELSAPLRYLIALFEFATTDVDILTKGPSNSAGDYVVLHHTARELAITERRKDLMVHYGDDKRSRQLASLSQMKDTINSNTRQYRYCETPTSSCYFLPIIWKSVLIFHPPHFLWR